MSSSTLNLDAKADRVSQTQFVSTDEAAERLQYTPQHVRRLIREGRLDGEKVGRDWLVTSDSLSGYLIAKDNLRLAFDPMPSRAEQREEKVEVDSDLTVEEILSGGEPTLDQKRLAKRLAWERGLGPEQTLHTIFQGDAREMAEVPDESVHLVVTSPPYFDLIDYENSTGSDDQLGNLRDYERFLAELRKVWERCYRALAPGGRLCVVVGDVCVSRKQAGRHFVIPLHADIARECVEIGFDYLTPIYWSKIANMATEVGGGARFLGKPYEPNAIIKNDVEYVLLLRKPGRYRRPTKAQRALSLIDPEDHRRWFRSVWTDIRGENRKAGHPAPYPSELAKRLIEMFSFVGDTVLDPFWGTGTTTHAAIRAGRSSIGYEIEESYVEIGRKRLAQQDFAVIPPVLEFRTSQD